MQFKEFCEIGNYNESEVSGIDYQMIEHIYMASNSMTKKQAVELYKTLSPELVNIIDDAIFDLEHQIVASDNQRKVMSEKEDQMRRKLDFFEDMVITLDAVSEKPLTRQYIEIKSKKYAQELEESIKELA